MLCSTSKVKQDENLQYADFTKMGNNELSHICFEALDRFKNDNEGQSPMPWDLNDAQEFNMIALDLANEYDFDMPPTDWKKEIDFFYRFAFQSRGVFNPICAFFGGFVA